MRDLLSDRKLVALWVLGLLLLVGNVVGFVAGNRRAADAKPQMPTAVLNAPAQATVDFGRAIVTEHFPSGSQAVYCPDHPGITSLGAVAHAYTQNGQRLIRYTVVDQGGKAVACAKVDETVTTASGTFHHLWWADLNGDVVFDPWGVQRETLDLSYAFAPGVTGSIAWP